MGRNRTYDRSTILDRAMQVFWRFGYGATTIAELAESTGVGKKTLFREFTSKEQLFTEALQLYTHKACSHVDSRLTPEPLGLDNLRSYLNSMTMWAANPLCLISKALAEFDLLADEHRLIVGNTLAYLENRFRENVLAAIRHNELAADTQVNTVVKYLVYSIYGMNSMGYFETSKATLRLVSSTILSGLVSGAQDGNSRSV